MTELGLDFPKTLTEFENRFRDEAACRRYLVELRWPEGYRCPACGHDRHYLLTQGHQYACRRCRFRTSLTAGTILHGTRKPLQMWFRAIWWVCTQKTGGSAVGLQKLLGLGSYQTAWAWLHKLRKATQAIHMGPLEETVVLGHGRLGRGEEDIADWPSFRMAKLLIAVELHPRPEPAPWRIRVEHVRQVSAKTLAAFVKRRVDPGVRLITDGAAVYLGLAELGYLHDVAAPGTEIHKAGYLRHVQRVIAMLNRWLLGTHQGGVRRKHLQSYLDEFVFRHNRRMVPHVGFTFCRMLEGAAQTPPAPYWQLVGRKQPDRPVRPKE